MSATYTRRLTMEKEIERIDYEQLKKAARFSQVPLDQLRRGDKINLLEDLWKMMQFDGITLATEEEFVKTSDEDLERIQDAYRDIFERIADAGDGKVTITWETKSPLNLALAARVGHPFIYRIFSKNVIEGCKLSLLLLLVRSRIAMERIRRCAAEDCKKVFVLGRMPDSTRSFHCSNKCAMRAGEQQRQAGIYKRPRKTKAKKTKAA